jgi:hypothetical protein
LKQNFKFDSLNLNGASSLQDLGGPVQRASSFWRHLPYFVRVSIIASGSKIACLARNTVLSSSSTPVVSCLSVSRKAGGTNHVSREFGSI